MFKVKKEEYVNKTFRFPITLLSKLEKLAQNENVSLNNLVVQCCEYSMDATEQTIMEIDEYSQQK